MDRIGLQDHPDGTYSASQAAEVLDLSKRRVLQMLERGELGGTKDESGRWAIPAHLVREQLLLRQAMGHTRVRPDAPRDAPPAADTRELVDTLKDQVEDLRARLDREQDANRENRRIIAGLIERIPELEAPAPSAPTQGASGSPETPAGDPPRGTAPQPSPAPQKPSERRRPWWRWIVGG